MAKTNLIDQLRQDYPELHFESGDDFYWSPDKKTVYYREIKNDSDTHTLLHELGHALLGHTSYDRDITLLVMEREAWEHAASQLAARYHTTIDQERIEESLDTYREWLHNRSRCPTCKLTGIQNSEDTYQCVGCHHAWRVNDARRVHLRRYALTR